MLHPASPHDKRLLRMAVKNGSGGSSAIYKSAANWQRKPPQTSNQRHPGEACFDPEVSPSLVPHGVHSLEPEQVLLFVDDGKGSGIPVVGCRLQSKSMAYKLSQPQVAPALAQLVPCEPQGIPVVGRRSHRFYHHHSQQQAHPNQHQQQLLMRGHHKSQCRIMNDDPQLREQYRAIETSQQALSGLYMATASGRRKEQKVGLYQSRSSVNVAAEPFLESRQLSHKRLHQQPLRGDDGTGHPVPARQHASRRQQVLHQAGPGLLAPINLISSSCSSLCSDECRSCCSPERQKAPCREPCCVVPYGYVMPSACRRACCQQGAPLAKPIVFANKPRPVEPRHAAHESLEYLYLAEAQPASGSRQSRTRLAHQGAAQRASSSHEAGRRRRCTDEQPMRISGRNMLPVRKKVPVLVGDGEPSRASRASNGLHKIEQQEPGVSQIYESLAAELKAKLGDPRLAPILLPPKDYDTLSRRQGRLSDIELRRSTNPQLVGSQMATITSTTAHTAASNGGAAAPALKQHSNERRRSSDKSATGAAGGDDKLRPITECDSTRSSGRQSHLEGSLSRSRSNSSSGLGSISVGAGSPNSCPSSKSSSSEDMRRMSANRGERSMMNVGVGEAKIAFGSPDNSAFSDSGHSESDGRADPAAKGDALLRAPSDYQKSASGASGVNGASAASSRSAKSSHSLDANQQPAAAKTADGSGGGGGGGLAASKARLMGRGPDGTLRWKGRVEIPLKVNSDKNGNTYLATKQIIY